MNLRNIDWLALVMKARDLMKAHGHIVCLVLGVGLAVLFGMQLSLPGAFCGGLIGMMLWSTMGGLDFPNFESAYWRPFSKGVLTMLGVFGMLCAIVTLILLAQIQ